MTAPTAHTAEDLERGQSIGGRIRASALLGTSRGLVSTILAVLMIAIAILAPVIAPYSSDQQGAQSFLSPGAGNLLGTDEFGRDILSRVIFAVRLDLVLAVLAIPVGAIIGTLLGLSGIWAKSLGQVSARVFDLILGFPTLILGIAVALLLTPGLPAVAVAIAIINIPVFGRLARGGMLAQLNRDYVMAAKSLGASNTRILLKQVLPNIRGALLVQSAISIADAVFIEGGLSILGLGVQPPTPSLGGLVQSGLPYITTSPMYVLGPTIALALIILGFGLLADTLNNRSET
ncbi:ABC transporter permease [Paenarthrobacter sp. 2TAF44]|uniref:ABC transporter permease n=1 Tax=Paenarthrobacter sp. 2TAF44 TaxID=3233018 RepID=UPI003F9E01CC